jgi:hypothetical protein
MKPCLLAAVSFLICGFSAGTDLQAGEREAGDKNRLVIHEWGTFTCLQNEEGQPIAGVNTDDEAVPEFVHRISDLIPRPSQLAPVYYKGVPRSHHDVRMRLETPVIYFYPPAGAQLPLHATVEVGFRGGWLTEYFPSAHVTVPRLKEGDFQFGGLTRKTMGTLEWHDLSIGGNYSLPETDAPVWLAPRQVQAAAIKAPGGESEKYLFYRGVGNLPSPLVAARSLAGNSLVIREELPPELSFKEPLSIRAMWLVHVRRDGSVAFRPLGAGRLTGQAGQQLLVSPVNFPPAAEAGATTRESAGAELENLLESYSPDNLAVLRSQMQKELIADGLFTDEAEAMLKTWELAYFKSPGLRLFYLLPQKWTDAILPLKCSEPAIITRTMFGRIELVTPQQRELLKQISAGPVQNTSWFYNVESDQRRREKMAQLWESKAGFQDLKIPVPREYQAYIDLGRFRNALILDAFTRAPKSGIKRFVDAYHLSYYTPPEEQRSGRPGGGE